MWKKKTEEKNEIKYIYTYVEKWKKQKKQVKTREQNRKNGSNILSTSTDTRCTLQWDHSVGWGDRQDCRQPTQFLTIGVWSTSNVPSFPISTTPSAPGTLPPATFGEAALASCSSFLFRSSCSAWSVGMGGKQGLSGAARGGGMSSTKSGRKCKDRSVFGYLVHNPTVLTIVLLSRVGGVHSSDR